MPPNSKESAVADFRAVTGASLATAKTYLKTYKTVDAALDAFYDRQSSQTAGSSTKAQEKKLGEIWEKFKTPGEKIVTIDGTMQLCEELEIDPASDAVLFCLAYDLGSKTTGEWEKESWVAGWMGMSGNIDSIEGMKSHLPILRQQLLQDPVYFKKVYMHTFDLAKAPGARTLVLDTAIDLWTLFILPALESIPSALARQPNGDDGIDENSDDLPEFGKEEFELWLDFQRERGKAVSKDTWSLFVDFIRTIDKDFKTYDDQAAWPSTIDDFVDYVRKKKSL